jgi:starch phosphorylase
MLITKACLPKDLHHPEQWTQMMKRAMSDVIPKFDSGRMAHEYYEKMYT